MGNSLGRTRHWVSSPAYRVVVDALVKARHEAGLSQQVVAGRLHKPASYVAKIELGERRLDLVEFVALARAIGVDESRLFAGVLKAFPAKLDV
jgi:transcriptional regulator with XRE-family HTH domain